MTEIVDMVTAILPAIIMIAVVGVLMKSVNKMGGN